jgi:hypothetical protein
MIVWDEWPDVATLGNVCSQFLCLSIGLFQSVDWSITRMVCL